MYRREELYAVYRSSNPPPAPGVITIKLQSISHEPARYGAKRIANTSPQDILLKGYMSPIDPTSEEDRNKLLHQIRNDCTEGCDARMECAKGTLPFAISYKWQSDVPGQRMSDIQFKNLRHMLSQHLRTLSGAKVTLWLDQHMRKHVGERERNDWLSYGTTAYRNSIVCYLPNVDITDNAREPSDASKAFKLDTDRLWIAFELRRATQGVGLMCGTGTELGICHNLVLDGPLTIVTMWQDGFIHGGNLTDDKTSELERSDIVSGRLLGINDSWDEFVINERAKLLRDEPIQVSEVTRTKHQTKDGKFVLSVGGEYENDKGLPAISISDVGPGMHSTSSHVVYRRLTTESRWDSGAILIAGDFDVKDKATEVSKVPLRSIAANWMLGEKVWIAHVSTKNAEKYYCIVTSKTEERASVIEILDVWPINSHIYDAALAGQRDGIGAVLANLDALSGPSHRSFFFYMPVEYGPLIRAPDLVLE